MIDPHPVIDPSPYCGLPWTFNFSKFRQATTWDERATYANKLDDDGVFDQRLVDGLAPRQSPNATGNNPIWCRWGPAPNAGWIVDQNGNVSFAQLWLEEAGMDAAMGRFALKATANASLAHHS